MQGVKGQFMALPLCLLMYKFMQFKLVKFKKGVNSSATLNM